MNRVFQVSALLLVLSLSGQTVLINSFRFAGGGGAPSYIYEQNFDGAGAPAGWSVLSGSPNYDYATAPAPLEGTQSLRQLNGAGSNTDNLFDLTEVWAYFLWHPVANASSHTVFAIWDGSFVENIGVNAQTGTQVLRINCGAVTDDTVTTYAAGTTYHIWVRYKKGTGANAEADLWFSTTATKPADGGNSHATLTTGTTTTNGRRLMMQSVFSGSDMIFDKVRVDDVAIGSSPP